MIRKIINWFNVEKTGQSFWDNIGGIKVYTFRYKINNKLFLATSKYSLFRVEKIIEKKSFDIPLRHAYSDIAQIYYERQK